MANDYTNREDYAEDDLECKLDPSCQLIDDHAGGCDHRREEERWRALWKILDNGDPDN